MRKMHIEEYDAQAHLERIDFKPKRVLVALKQNAGASNVSLVKANEPVSAGQQIGEIPEGGLGAIIHAPFAGVVELVTDKHIILNRA
jgi:Na+-translocating ferredoxin:NAD+ oxidoreductase RnfC subunit